MKRIRVITMVDTLTDEEQDIIETAAEVIYGLIHARYLITGRGMQKMVRMYVMVFSTK